MTDDLKRELEDIEKKLADQEFVLDYKRVAEASKRYAELQRMLERDANSEGMTSDVIVEIRAGAGGEEAALFAQQLFEMYRKYGTSRGWTVNILDYNTTDLGGTKYVAFEINGSGADARLAYESGVHRVQRVPKTEKDGRIHTSTATVAVLKKAKKTDIEIKPEEIEISFYRSGGPGGQNVNKVSTAVRIVHKPSGLVVSSQRERSQSRNREIALDLLRSKLLDLKQREETGKITEERKKQVGTGDRSEKIRTYNFPQDRITDHRVKKSWSNVEKVLAGALDPVVDTLLDAAKAGM